MGLSSIAKKKLKQRAKDRAEDKITEKKGSIAKKTTISATDIKEASTANAMDTMQRRIDDMPDGTRKKMMQDMLDNQRTKFESKQASDVDKMERKQQQSARDKKMKGNVTLPSLPFNKGGMASRKGNYDMRRGGMFMK
jgi:hypothetical protein